MIKFKKILPYLTAAALIFFFELSYYYYLSWLWWLLGINICIILTILILNNFHFNKETLGFVLTPLVLCNAVFGFLLFQENTLIKQTIIFITCFFSWLFLHNLSVFYYNYKAYFVYSLENISGFINLLALFFLYVSVFAFYILSVSRLRWLIALVFCITLALAWQTLWVNKVSSLRTRYLPWASAIITTEMFWVCHYWPTSFYVNGLILIIVYYVIINLGRLYFLDSLTKKHTWRYLASSSLIVAAILATAQWT